MAFTGSTREEAIDWQKQFRAKYRELIGLGNFESCDLNPKLLGKEDMGSYWREDWTINTEPDVIAPFYALVPKDISPGERRPAVACPHGHGSAGRYSPAGRSDLEVMKPVIEHYNYDYAVQLAERGAVTFAIDARGFGQRRIQHAQNDRDVPDTFINGSCHMLMIMGYPLGQTVNGMWTWDLMRLLDYIATRGDCDADRIGCAGLSGGGLQTLSLAAVDERVKAAVVSGYFYGVKDSLIRKAGNCDCNCVPHLWEHADMGDVGALIAPRGLFIETGDSDPLNGESGLKNVYSQTAIAKKVFDALSADSRLGHHVFEGEHRWCGEQAIPWLLEQL